MSGGLRDILNEIRSEYGRLTPAIVLEVARQEDHPLHSYAAFKWNDDEAAADAYRLSVARDLIRTVRVTYKQTSGEMSSVRAYHAIRTADEDEYEYEAVEDILADPMKRRIVVRDMERQIAELVSRYEHFQEFWDLIRKASRRKKAS